MDDISTDAFFGSELQPIAIRLCFPCSPKTSYKKSDAPLIIIGCSEKLSEEFTKPDILTHDKSLILISGL